MIVAVDYLCRLSPKLKHWGTIWVEPLVLARGVMVAVDYLCRLSPKLKHWVTICAEPLVLARGERVL